MIHIGDTREVLRTLPDGSVQTCVTSPPYWGLRDYGVENQLGLEKTPEEYVAHMVEVFREVKRVLRDDGTLWLNLGDSYASPVKGSGGTGKSTLVGTPNDGNGQLFLPRRFDMAGLKAKDLCGIPWRVAFALQADGWYLRQDIIWHKPNPMPESVTDRCTKAHEYIFLLSKSARYYFDNKAIMEPAQYGEQHAKKATSWGTNRKHPNKANVADYAFAGDNHTTSKMEDGSHGRNKRSVWTVTTKPFKGAHFATFPEKLIEPCILAGAPKGGVVLDPFFGAGTTGVVAKKNGREYIGIELNPVYAKMAEERIAGVDPKPTEAKLGFGCVICTAPATRQLDRVDWFCADHNPGDYTYTPKPKSTETQLQEAERLKWECDTGERAKAVRTDITEGRNG